LTQLPLRGHRGQTIRCALVLAPSFSIRQLQALLFVLCALAVLCLDGGSVLKTRPYHIVLVGAPMLDYLLPMRALAKELARRGHMWVPNVLICLDEELDLV
jgi:hypothetical protein